MYTFTTLDKAVADRITAMLQSPPKTFDVGDWPWNNPRLVNGTFKCYTASLPDGSQVTVGYSEDGTRMIKTVTSAAAGNPITLRFGMTKVASAHLLRLLVKALKEETQPSENNEDVA